MDSLRFYEAPDGFRWTYIAENGNVLADGGEAYENRRDAVAGACRVVGSPPAIVWERSLTLSGMGSPHNPVTFPVAFGGRNIQMEVEW